MLKTLKKAWGRVNEAGDDTVSWVMTGLTRRQLSGIIDFFRIRHDTNMQIISICTKARGAVSDHIKSCRDQKEEDERGKPPEQCEEHKATLHRLMHEAGVGAASKKGRRQAAAQLSR